MFVNSKLSVLTAHTVQRRAAGNPVKVNLAGGDVDIYQHSLKNCRISPSNEGETRETHGSTRCCNAVHGHCYRIIDSLVVFA